MRDVLFARCSYAKEPSRRLLLTVERERRARYAYKQPGAPEARPWLEELGANERAVAEYVGGRADVLVGEPTPDGRLRYAFLEQPTVQYLLAECLDGGRAAEAFATLDRAVSWIRQLPLEEADPRASPELASIYGEALQGFGGPVPSLRLGLLDLNADNFLYDRERDRYTLIDHEIVLPCPVPLELSVFRFVFFALTKLGNLLDVQADGMALRAVGGGLFRVPSDWDLPRWIDEPRLGFFLDLEERLQERFTGRRVAWPRPLAAEGIGKPGRQRRNAAGQLAQLRSTLGVAVADRDSAMRQLGVAVADRDSAMGQLGVAVADRDSAMRQLGERDAALAAAGAALGEHQEQTALARASERHAWRQLRVAAQRERATQLWLEGELTAARQRGAELERLLRRPWSRVVAAVRRRLGNTRRRLLALAVELRQPWPILKRRLKTLVKAALARPRAAWGPPPPAPAAGSPRVHLASAPGTPWTGPLFSVVVPESLEGAQRTAVLEALRAQTPGSLEVVLWNAAEGRACLADRPEQWWRLPAGLPVGETLLGKYACVASPALAAIPAAFFEANAMALEAEDLDAALNQLGDGASLLVARSEALDGTLGFSADRLPERAPSAHVCGRVIRHDGAPGGADWDALLPASRRETARVGPHLLLRAPEARPWGDVTHVFHPVDSVLAGAPAPSSRPRVLVAFSFIAVGGAETLTRDVLARLADRYEFVVVALEPLDPTVGSMAAEFRAVTPHLYVLPELLRPQLNFSALASLVERHGVETLFVANGCAFTYDAAPSLRARFPRLHMVNQVYDHRMGWIDRYDAGIAGAFDRHVAPNPKVADAYTARGVERSRIDLIYHGIDCAAFDPALYPAGRVAELRARLGLPGDRPVVGFFARMHPQKRPLDFVALAQRFDPGEAAFLMVGDGPLASEIDRQIARAKVPHLLRLPFHKPFADVLAAADVVVVPSEYEGLPLVSLQAQAMGKPVVATDVGALREVLEFTGGGAIVPRIGDVAGFARAVRAMLAAPPPTAAARERVRERFDVARAAALYGDSFARR